VFHFLITIINYYALPTGLSTWDTIKQRFSTWGTRAPGGTQAVYRAYTKF
jgi:hypothetical protein